MVLSPSPSSTSVPLKTRTEAALQLDMSMPGWLEGGQFISAEVTFPASKPLALMKDSGALLVFTVGGLPCPPCPSLWAPCGHPCMAPCFPMLCSLSASTLSPHRGQGRRRMGPQLFSKIRPPALCWVPPSDPCFHICAGKCPVSGF